MCISAFGPSSPSSSLVILFIHSAFSLCLFGCHIFVQNHWVSFAFGCWYILCSSPPNYWYNFLSLFWNVLFYLYCFTLCRYLFNLPSFASSFWFIFSSFIVSFSCVVFSFLFLIIPASFFCFIIFACFRRFFIWVSSRNSHPDFDFSFVLFEGILIFSQTNFAPVWISSFNSFILFVDIYVSTWFTLFVSALTILHSMNLYDGKVVLSLLKILFKFSRFNFYSCVSVCSGLFCCAVFGWVEFTFSEFGGSFRMGWVC